MFDGRGEQCEPLHWTISDAFEGTQIFGETGSGKTSGSGAALAHAFLKKGFGGLVLTAKTTDADEWLNPESGFVKRAGGDPADRSRVVVIGEPVEYDPNGRPCRTVGRVDPSKTFNFLDYEFEVGRQPTQNLVQLFLTAVDSGSQKNTGQEDAYWADALRQLLTNAIDLVLYATRCVSVIDICAVVQSAPQSREEARSAAWQADSECWRLLARAQQNLHEDARAAKQAADATLAAARMRDFRQTVDYWLLDFAGLADRTRSVIVSSFTAKATGLTRYPLFDLFCAGKVNGTSFVDIVRETRAGRLVILNLPVKRYGEIGRFAQVLIKTVWQRAVERSPDRDRPVFLWADEAQFFATKEDMLFQTTARTSGCATVYLTQNICNYHSMMPGPDPRSATDALLGNLTTKIFHANGDPTTNQWAQQLFGNDIGSASSQSVQTGGEKGAGGMTLGTTDTVPIPVVQAKDFANLRRGGEANGYVVDAIVFRSGYKHANRKAIVPRTSFDQLGKE